MQLQKSNIKDMVRVIEISENTGEVVEYTKKKYTEEYKEKLNKNKIVAFDGKVGLDYLKNEFGSFFFYFYNKLDAYDIPAQYKLRFLYLASYLDYNNGYLIIKGQYNTKIRLNKQTMKDLLNLKDREFRKTENILVDTGLLIKDGTYYNSNTDCTVRGDLPCSIKNKDYTRVFISTIQDLYTKCDPRSHKQLYYIFKMLPYVNFKYNMVCHNVNQDVMSDINPMTMPEICDKIGYERINASKLWRILRGFKVGGDYAICKHCVDEGEYITINPRIYYSGKSMKDIDYLINIFDMAKTA